MKTLEEKVNENRLVPLVNDMYLEKRYEFIRKQYISRLKKTNRTSSEVEKARFMSNFELLCLPEASVLFVVFNYSLYKNFFKTDLVCILNGINNAKSVDLNPFQSLDSYIYDLLLYEGEREGLTSLDVVELLPKKIVSTQISKGINFVADLCTKCLRSM